MNTVLHEINDGTNVPGREVGASSLTENVVLSIPQSEINSDTFLQQMTFTGMQVRVPLPFGAENGFQPLFAVRNGPLIFPPHFDTGKATLDPLIAAPNDANLKDRTINSCINAIPCRPFNGCTLKFTGPEPPQSIFASMYRFWRGDIVYNLRLSSTYTGGGILMIVPMKGLPRGTPPISSKTSSNMFGNAMMINSNIQADLSKSRQIRFVYPYEYPTEFQDLEEDYARIAEYDPTSPVSKDMISNYDNWFVVGVRGSLIAPTNASYLDFYIDYAFGQYSLHTPILPLYKGVSPVHTSYQFYDTAGTKLCTKYFQYTEDDFTDVNQEGPVTPTPPSLLSRPVSDNLSHIIQNLQLNKANLHLRKTN